MTNNSPAVRLNRWMLGLSRQWLRVLVIILLLYVGLPVAAPTLMHFGLTGPGRLIYTMYSPLCHQFAFRTWFLYGEQAAYPRAAANVPGIQPYEAFSADVIAATGSTTSPQNLSNWTADLINLSRGFIGNQQMGYKMALCERDMGIYGALLAACFIYAIPYVRARLRPVPLWLYVLLGIVPIGIDGFSQLLSEAPINLWPMRESTPAFRTLTGILFGLANAWLALPYIEDTMRQTAMDIRAKFDQRVARETSQADNA